MARNQSVQPQEVIDAVGTRNASVYDFCPCGRVKAKKAKVCRECFDTEND